MHPKTLLALALSLPLTATALKASFTEYGAGDSMGSPNCATSINACGEPGGGYTAALSQSQFGAGPGDGAGPACGTCYKLTVTTDLSGHAVTENSVTVRVNNLCPTDGNPICSVPNQYGAEIHFDLCRDSGATANFFTSSQAGIGTAEKVSC
ncbi:hypothetical protein VF21_07963 [Pseudogymnoascus sp. 05NY08]|nr:hypothetical protein VF21_07963 [Pseudogymnoascus sp. 05NY08]